LCQSTNCFRPPEQDLEQQWVQQSQELQLQGQRELQLQAQLGQKSPVRLELK
jgi:hypothetical protein